MEDMGTHDDCNCVVSAFTYWTVVSFLGHCSVAFLCHISWFLKQWRWIVIVVQCFQSLPLDWNPNRLVVWAQESDDSVVENYVLHKTYHQCFCHFLFLQAAKLANYAKYQRLCDFLFIVFSVAFFITRLVIYPIWWVLSDTCSLRITATWYLSTY